MDPSTMSPNGAESPPIRQTILGSFLRGRRHSNSQLNPPLSPTTEAVNPLAMNPPGPPPSGSPQPGAISHSPSATGAFSGMLALRRRRSAGALNTNGSPNPATPPPVPASPSIPTAAPPAIARAATQHQPPPALGTVVERSAGPAHRIRLVPHLESRRSLRFDAITRDVKEGDQPLRIGRFTDRSGSSMNAANALGSNKLAFKSKVVSRTHAEIWAENGGKFYIRDTKSSSGTFLNHVRLSPANSESRPHELKDGDILQLGVDYQGGTEDIYKCVKIRIEVGREWQAQANAFNTNALKQLKSLAVDLSKSKEATDSGKKVSTKTGLPDCCICLFSVTIQQALFIAPCSHAFHYKCLRPLLDNHYPAFICPLCRTFADLEADVEVDDVAEGWDDTDEAILESASPKIAPTISASISRRDADDAMNGGMETEVEADSGATRLGVGLRRGGVPGASTAVGGNRHLIDLSHLAEADEEDDDARSVAGDAEMMDAHGHVDPEQAAMLHIAGVRGHSHSPGGVLSEDEGEVFLAAVDAMDVAEPSSHSHRAGTSARVVSADSASSEGEASAMDGGDGTLAGKRKR